MNKVPTIELQLLEPEQSRRIWTASVDGKIYVWSGYMNSLVGKLWKSWPSQAERDGRAVIRVDEADMSASWCGLRVVQGWTSSQL